MSEVPKKTALILTGGGARAAYQVGVLKALAEWLPKDSPCPFPIIVGTSAGAVAAIALAGRSGRFRAAVNALEQVWANFHVEQVFRADTVSMLRAGLHWLLAFVSSWGVATAAQIAVRQLSFARASQPHDVVSGRASLDSEGQAPCRRHLCHEFQQWTLRDFLRGRSGAA